MEIEQFIARIPDSMDRQIFELAYLEGKTYREIADEIHLDYSRVSRRIAERLKNATKATK